MLISDLSKFHRTADAEELSVQSEAYSRSRELLSVKNSGKPAKLASVTRALLSHLQATAHLLTSAACSA